MYSFSNLVKLCDYIVRKQCLMCTFTFIMFVQQSSWTLRRSGGKSSKQKVMIESAIYLFFHGLLVMAYKKISSLFPSTLKFLKIIHKNNAKLYTAVSDQHEIC